MTRRLNAVAVCVILAVAGTSLAGCSIGKEKNAEDTNAAKGKNNVVKVVATTTQICDYVTQIASDKSADATLAFTKMDSAGKVTHSGAAKDKAQSEIDLT